ncbi:alpha/beta hydrolase family protein [Gimesia maris]|mgnify:FL=1|uniref:alpha/beta hydrolase family protein n=1 Tax=Gimesia maris TaxID=122 RepID=UPI00241DE05F|nr:prolyl oligopeptidase family serine peptidase [Gimesia maris]|tara:strand:- start:87432 stop:88448 length:1017 start_codon:yes stop_codon:yes gene_type:complete
MSKLVLFALFVSGTCALNPENLSAAENVAEAKQKPAKLELIKVKSSLDDSLQPSMFWAPASAKTTPAPLFVFLHSWSGNYKQNNAKWLQEAEQRGWIYLHPDFRGVNQQPEACGSRLARQDILDAIEYVIKHYNVDQSRIYLAGSSGGGHMTMLMAGHHPDRFSAASAWVGISDLAEWYRFHLKDGVPQNYARMILKSLTDKPGTSEEIDVQYRDRSPLFWIDNATELPLDLNAGVTDGQTGSVPFAHTINAFNVLAKKNQTAPVTEAEIEQLWNQGTLTNPQASDQETDETYGREIHLRRKSGNARVTIFQGGHEGLPEPACEWLSKRSRDTSGFGK